MKNAQKNYQKQQLFSLKDALKKAYVNNDVEQVKSLKRRIKMKEEIIKSL